VSQTRQVAVVDGGGGHNIAQFIYRLCVHRFLLIGLAEVHAGPDVTRIHFQHSLVLLDHQVILTRIKVDPADVNLYDERERIEFLAFDEVARRRGKIRSVALRDTSGLLLADRPEYEWELMPLALDQKVGTLVWSPLGWGRLTGRIRRNQPLYEESRLHQTADKAPPVPDELLYRVVDVLDEVAEETGKTLPQIALNWLLPRPTVASVIIGARNEAQLRQNLGAVGWSLSDEQMAKLDAASQTTPSYPYWHQTLFGDRNPPPVPSRQDSTSDITERKPE
jgi:Aldo/keto reductase family